ncbi:MAG: invasion protein CiaB [Sulfurovaceae bacterium]|nr:invasion protein CiaB [Sulfurovaceae bacterium]MDD5549232.1 invasion protein CiaB [Sulfurovaceae bacterium]
MKQDFLTDIQKIYDELTSRQDKLNSYFKLLHESHKEAQKIVDDFLEYIQIEKDSDSIMAALSRIVNLKEDFLEQVLQRVGCDSDEIVTKKELAYSWVSDFYTKYHKSLLDWVEEKNLLSPFYRTILFGVHDIGLSLNNAQSRWTNHIIHTINANLFKKFDGDEKRVLEYLHNFSLFDKDTFGVITDRSYSALKENEDGSHSVHSYNEIFRTDIENTSKEISKLISELSNLDDEVYHQKSQWIKYFNAINDAFCENNVENLLSKWQEVDIAWMSITTPIQVGHPLEYYEDHFRKAVALEWDVRIINPKLQTSSSTRENIKGFTASLAKEIGKNAISIAKNNILQVDKTQLYIGQPMLYYAAELNGLFSAQVVPNDKMVSDKYGHKIFAYSDFVLASKLAKPTMKLSVEVMGKEFVKNSRNFAEHCPSLWHEVYDISTIGHEFGHILWLESDTEGVMNKSGQFKNIEEFKATSGGLMAFFHNERENLKEHIVDDLVSRSIGLMAWREVGEVLPYYCEGLIHLDILFKSKIIRYENEIVIDYSKYEEMKNAYKESYKNLATHYVNKLDASEFLHRYTAKENGVYLPKDKDIKEFVEYYYDRYKEIGQQSIVLE